MIKRLARLQPRIEAAGHQIRFAVTRGPFNVASFLMGTTEFLSALKTDPDATHRLLSIVTAFLEDWIAWQRECFPSIDGLLVLDDIAGFVSRRDFEAFGLPYFTRTFATDVTVKLFHNDASCKGCAPYLARMGVNLLNFGPQHTMTELRSWAGESVALMGNIPPRDVLAAGTPADVTRAVRNLLDSVEGQRRIIVSCGGGMPPGVPTLNIEALVAAVAAHAGPGVRGRTRVTGPALAVTTRLRRACRRAALVAALVLGATSAAGRESGRDLWLRYPRIEDQALREAYGRSASAIVVSTASPTGKLIAGELHTRPRRPSRRRCPGSVIARGPGRHRGRHARDLSPHRATRPVAGTGTRRRRGLSHPHDEGRRARRHRHRVAHGNRRALRRVPLPAPAADRPADREPRHRRAAAHGAPAAQPLGQPRRHASSAATRARRCGSGPSCPAASIRASRTTRAPTRRSASTAPCSTTSTPTRVADARRTSRRPPRWRGVFRPYGIRVYLSANFAAPTTLGGLPTADPLDPAVARWWREKADEIYRLIPDFGGFLVKANCEGQPGPQDYKRTHADGANMLADAVGPHGGIVMWRAFVYDAERRPRPRQARLPRVRAARRPVPRQRARAGEERPARLPAARAVQPAVRRDAAHAADGRAADHAGVPRPVDAPRVPGADVEGVPRRRHVRGKGPGSTVAQGRRRHRSHGHRRTGIAGVANTGSDAQLDAATTSARPTGTRSAGWRGIPTCAPAAIADEWIRMTWSADAATSSRRSGR